MATRAEDRVVNLAGLVQGITLVTFPAASSIFTSRDDYGLSESQYGSMFLPQVAMAIAASLLGARLARRITTKRVLLLGLSANIASMVVLLLSTTVMSDESIAYALLLTATALLGLGFGLTVPVLNTYAALFHPTTADRAVLVLNALLGLGTVLAPVFVAVFVGLGFWWGLPLLSTLLLVLLLLLALPLPLDAAAADHPATSGTPKGTPARFWLYASFAVMYGICETMNGNWSQLDMTTNVGASATQASLALTAFWAMVTFGRLLFSAINRWVPTRLTFHVLPFALIGTFVLTATLPSDQPWRGVLVFGLAGLGCSALLPLTISFGQAGLPTMSSAVAGGVIAFYQVGYGIAAFGVGWLLDAGQDLSTIYGWTAVIAAAMALLSFLLAHGQRSPRRLHPRPSDHPAVATSTT